MRKTIDRVIFGLVLAFLGAITFLSWLWQEGGH